MSEHGVSMPRLALANWDYSWLTRGGVRGGEYHHLDRVMVELRERGFNALRVDPCPHLIAPTDQGLVMERFEIPSRRQGLRRGSARPITVRPRKALVELLAAAQRNDVHLWFSSWFVPDSQARRSFVRRPGDFVRVWSETLEFIRREGYASRVLAVDFCHEFPSAPWNHGAFRRIFRHHPANPLAGVGAWSAKAQRRAEHYLLEVPRALRAVFPAYRYGVSTNLSLQSELRQLDTSELDFLDCHLWLNDDRQFQIASTEGLPLPGGRLASRLQGRVAALAWRARREYWQKRLADHLDEILEFSNVRRMQPVITEGFLRVPVEAESEWPLQRELNDWIVQKAVDGGVEVLTPGFYARPHSPSFWADVAWLRQCNGRILDGAPL